MSEWIKCSDRLPEIGYIVLYFSSDLKLGIGAGYLESDGSWNQDVSIESRSIEIHDVTHWQLLPDPPISIWEYVISGFVPIKILEPPK